MDFRKLTVAELKKQLKDIRAKISGIKAELIEK